jgi:hypothetical protein
MNDKNSNTIAQNGRSLSAVEEGASGNCGSLESEGPRGPKYELGEWFWYNSEKPGTSPKLMCLTKIGSNFYQLKSPGHHHLGYSSVRTHHNDADECLTHEPNPSHAIQERLGYHQKRVQQLMGEVQELTSRLGITPDVTLPSGNQSPDANGQALAVLSDSVDIKAYENALVKAKKEDLPKLFDEIKTEQYEVARWMAAETLPLQAQAESLKESLSDIDSRIFNVSLYAGLTESIEQVADGEPAPMGTKLHVMQRRLYMDEECLLNYRVGGMEFGDISEFDEWLLQEENLNRILPFSRCIVAMRVRRIRKERVSDGTLRTAFVNFNLEQADKTTFLYIRNGERVYRLNSDQDFGELIFPDKATYDPSEPIMVKMFAGRVSSIITVREYEDRVAKTEACAAKGKQWEAENPYDEWRQKRYEEQVAHWESRTDFFREVSGPFEEWIERQMKSHASKHRYEYANPYQTRACPDYIDEREWSPFDSSNLDYDTIAETIAAKIQEYNRIALIIQGLFDRSTVLHPHGKVRTWEPESFAENIELVYDGSALLTYGEAPDIREYIQHCNESLGPGSVTVGQEDFWLRKEAEKENNRRARSWRETSSGHDLTHFQPLGNKGPGFLARLDKWKPRVQEGTFSWNRERLTSTGYYGEHYGDPIRTTITVPAEHLLNCDAYQLGDYKRFFRDPRTRADYLDWAPMLLAAEEYKSGALKPQEPVRKP